MSHPYIYIITIRCKSNVSFGVRNVPFVIVWVVSQTYGTPSCTLSVARNAEGLSTRLRPYPSFDSWNASIVQPIIQREISLVNDKLVIMTKKSCYQLKYEMNRHNFYDLLVKMNQATQYIVYLYVTSRFMLYAQGFLTGKSSVVKGMYTP